MGASASGFHEGKCVTSTSNTPCQRTTRNSDSSKTFSAMHSGDQLVGVSVREKKKKMTGFATLRRKLIRRRRTSKSYDHGKVIREFVADWSPLELNTLVEEYEATAALKDLSVQADLARPPASTHKQDLSDLFDYKYASDVTLIFQGACFPVHRAILSSRCSYFRELLTSAGSGNNTRTVHGAQVHVDSLLQSRGIDVPTFAALLRYLYTGDFCLLDGGDTTSQTDMDVLIRLGQEFGTPNQLEHDLRYLMDTGDLADAVLVFASGQDFALATGKPHCSNSSLSNSTGNIGSSSSDYGFYPRMEMRCHRAILSSRSPFFRSLIQRRCRTTENAVTPTRIILDESVIPRRYAQVLMQALYLDTVDMSCIIRSGPSESSSTTEEAPSSTNGAAAGLPAAATGLPVSRPIPPTLFEEATELYQIGRFLELDILSQGCEDVIVDNLSLDNLPQVLRWSELPHGSPWVRRQALQLLREEFSAIAQAPVLLELDKNHLVEALQSDFLQASELEVLQAVLRWGEHQLVRRMEDREPNIVSQTAHSVARKGVRRRDLNDVELRDILSELLPHVRVDHVLPPSHESLAQAIRRGLVSTPPSHMIGGDNSHKLSASNGGPGGGRGALSAWIRGHHHHQHHTAKHHTGLYVKPRLFMPYFEETKSLLADQLVQEMELVRHRMVRMSSHIPDTLYMIDDAPAGMEAFGQMATSSSNATNDLDVVTGAVPVPDSETLQAMIRRERKLRLSPLAQRAYSLQLASRRDINRQIRLRVVREFNLPDSIAEELESAAYQFAEEADESQQHQIQQQIQATSALIWEPRKSSSIAVRVPVPPKRMTSRPKPFQKSEPVLDLAMDDDGHQLHQSQLSEFIPDIAALSINPLPQFVPSLQPIEPYRELQLDLGDGASVSRLSSVEWSFVRSGVNPSLPAASNPIRMSTFRSDDEWAEQQAERPSASLHRAVEDGAVGAVAATSTGTGSPRTQRRSRSGRAADVRVFI
ncbi:BTB/POZ domain-containing protein 7 [Daphnia magna]|uniref:BTB/POZ domain-containing protein 7 n=1 Tax=Daphnia magna TaxID=35525 RepID=A0A162RVF4_9CRUS|nr:BTB/POZ domain-containing protein 7 [Daphnia magna]